MTKPIAAEPKDLDGGRSGFWWAAFIMGIVFACAGNVAGALFALGILTLIQWEVMSARSDRGAPATKSANGAS